MNEYLNLETLLQELQRIGELALSTVLDGWLLLQAVLLAVTYVAARLTGRALRPHAQRQLDRLKVRPRVRPLIAAAPEVLVSVLFLVMLWLEIGVMRKLTWPSNSYLLGVVASLMTAWVVIKLSSTFIRNAAVAQTLALTVWSLAALNITGLLDPTLAALDSLAVNFGELRVSLLTVIKGVLSATILLWAASALSRVLETRIKRAPDLSPSIQVLMAKLLKITLLTIAILIALKSVGIDLTALALLSGAIGLGIGFGLQKVVSNLISGVILLLDKSIKPGDVIELGETFGWISSLGARYVSVVTRDGKEYLIPNEDLITQRVVNWSFSNQLVRLEVPVGVSYDSDPHAVRRLLITAAASAERVLSEPKPVCHLVGFGESSLDFVLRFWIRDPQQGVVNVKGKVLLAVWDALKEAGIEIPYPHRQILLREPVSVKGSTAAAS